MNPHGCQLAAPLCGLRAGRPQLGRVRTLAQGGGPPHGPGLRPDLSRPERFSSRYFLKFFPVQNLGLGCSFRLQFFGFGFRVTKCLWWCVLISTAV
jgi:hypothetical protein